jgi:hypothetical protein
VLDKRDERGSEQPAVNEEVMLYSIVPDNIMSMTRKALSFENRFLFTSVQLMGYHKP